MGLGHETTVMVWARPSSSPGHSHILSHGCEIKSGSGLGTRLGVSMIWGTVPRTVPLALYTVYPACCKAIQYRYSAGRKVGARWASYYLRELSYIICLSCYNFRLQYFTVQKNAIVIVSSAFGLLNKKFWCDFCNLTTINHVEQINIASIIIVKGSILIELYFISTRCFVQVLCWYSMQGAILSGSKQILCRSGSPSLHKIQRSVSRTKVEDTGELASYMYQEQCQPGNCLH